MNYTLLAAQREKGTFVLFILNLDRFKEINDRLGHQIGDVVLKEVGVRFKHELRGSDTVARIGGDEFAVILPNVGLAGGRLAATKILKALEDPIQTDRVSLFTQASIGIVLFPDHGGDVETLLRRADRAMYAAKRSGAGYAVCSSKPASRKPASRASNRRPRR